MEENYNLKKFLGVGLRTRTYFISFNKSGFLISSGFCSKENIKDFSKVVLYYDEDKSAVGIQFTNEVNAEGAFTLVHGNHDTTASISARSFIKANNLNNPKYFGRRSPKKITYEDMGDIFIVDLIEKVDEDSQTSVQPLSEAVG